jgi:hypothetical protein
MLAFAGHRHRQQARHQGLADTALAADYCNNMTDIAELMGCFMQILRTGIGATGGAAGTTIMITFFSH